MAPKRRANTSLLSKGLLPGEQLNRDNISSSSSCSLWGWVGNIVTDAKNITLEHRLATCNLLSKRNAPCLNKYSPQDVKVNEKPKSSSVAEELDDDIIVISDDEGPSCSKKGCKADPNCLNYLGQQAWENEDGPAQDAFFKAMKLGSDPSQDSREIDMPVGLKNLGATCYANASLQVWYRDLTFRSGVYSCEPPEDVTEEKYKDSPIFQLQVTFAALQEGNKSVFNPKKLVESLQLRTSEQQDAQEFSKLFISHLDVEFKKQSSPSIKTLITDQFQGTQAYGTICHACKNRSERPCDFLELEISFNNNSNLEDRLEASLLPEQLSGDNRYFCSRCDSLQDATRYTELRRLPPVLHFSLLRFVYDINTMERKKSKHSISFPYTLDMRKFMGSKNDRGRPQDPNSDGDVYELRGILLHKGPSAYHGHYEAQVNDVETGSWFQFNDDVATKIDKLGDKVPSRKLVNTRVENDEEIEEKPNPAQLRKDRINARKRRRIEDSDDEDVVEIKETPLPQQTGTSRTIITSRDAYMLIYARKTCHQNSRFLENDTTPIIPHASPKPPNRVMDVIRNFNATHDEACKGYKAKTERAQRQFSDLRHKVQNIYMNWNATNFAESVIVSRQALETWLSEHGIEASVCPQDIDGSNTPTKDEDNPGPVYLSMSDIVCEHGALDPTKSKDMKRVDPHSVDEILKETNCIFEPLLKPSDVCVECVSSLFNEKLYEMEHPKLAKKLEEIYICHEGQMGYWISKKWLKDWKLNKPRMHKPSEPDPAPDSSEYNNHVVCEHGGLSMNAINRRKISSEAANLLQELFPAWKPLSSDTETCVVCDAEIHISKEDKKESRRRVEDEKARLKFIYEPPLDFWTNSTNNASCAIIPSQFVKKWNRWVANPCANNPRPDSVDNTTLLCEHKLLCFDPNCAFDMHSALITIQRDEWDVLQGLYPAGPLISLTRRTTSNGGGYDHDIPVCAECRMKRKIEWEMTEVTIRLSTSGSSNTGPNSDFKTKPTTYARVGGARQSKRLRQNKLSNAQRTFTLTKFTTVKDLKVMANEEFSIPTIQQRLFYKGEELEDNTATASALGLFANDVIELRQAEEVNEIYGSDSDEVRPSKKRREEAGFGGTLLGNVDSSWSSSPEPVPSSSLPITEDKPCLACTFSNTLDALYCEMCETHFI